MSAHLTAAQDAVLARLNDTYGVTGWTVYPVSQRVVITLEDGDEVDVFSDGRVINAPDWLPDTFERFVAPTP